jgi:HEAT repeat protein
VLNCDPRIGRFSLLLVLAAASLGCGKTSGPTVDGVAHESTRELPPDMPAELRTLLEQLRVVDPLVRATAARQLRALGPAAAPAAVFLRAALADPSWEVRADVAQALGAIGDREAMGPLIERLERDEDWSVRGRAAAALGILGDRRATPPLRVALSDMACFVRRAAAVALGQLADPAAAEALATAAQCDSDATVREAAKMALDRCTTA